MRIASVAEVKAKLSSFLLEAGATGPVVITRNGKAVAVLLAPADDDDLERLLLSRSPQFQSLLSKSRASLRAGKGIPHAAFWTEVRQSAARLPHHEVSRTKGSQPPAGGLGSIAKRKSHKRRPA